MRQRFLVVEHRAEIAHIKPTVARFAFVKMLGLAQWRSVRLPITVPRGMIRGMRAILVMLFPKDRSEETLSPNRTITDRAGNQATRGLQLSAVGQPIIGC